MSLISNLLIHPYYIFITNYILGSHGMPGIYFQYDINALKFIITEKRITMFHLIIEIASTIGGLFLLFSKYIDKLQILYYKLITYL